MTSVLSKTASMGPRSNARNGWAVVHSRRRTSPCFNGAAQLRAERGENKPKPCCASSALQRGRAVTRGTGENVVFGTFTAYLLQWGRAVTRGTGAKAAEAQTAEACFNGAAQLRAERAGCEGELTFRIAWLQWGRAVTRGTGPSRRGSGTGFRSFNGAAQLRAERAKRRTDAEVRSGGFNGAAQLRAERGRRGCCPACRRLRFNGAAQLRAERVRRNILENPRF